MQELGVVLAFAAFVIWFCDHDYTWRSNALGWFATFLILAAMLGAAYSLAFNGQWPGSGQGGNYSSPYSVQ